MNNNFVDYIFLETPRHNLNANNKIMIQEKIINMIIYNILTIL